MSPEMTHIMLVVLQVLLVVVVGAVTSRSWNRPLDHGPQYFLDIEVPPRFYEAEGQRWLRRYHAALAATAAPFVIGLAFAFANQSLFSIAIWLQVVPYVVFLVGFPIWARRALKITPRQMSGLALAFENRPLGEHISWAAEAALAVVLATLWAIMLWRTPKDWHLALILSWLAIGILPTKVILLRGVIPLPPERVEEYHRWVGASRNVLLQIADRWRWLFVGTFALIVAGRGWPALLTPAWSRPALFFASLALYYWQLRWMGRALKRVVGMGRALRPAGSWSGPFGPAKPSFPGGRIWFLSYLGGLALLLVWLAVSN